jgi:thiosulfate dehydrogenase [quinone] large subunit
LNAKSTGNAPGANNIPGWVILPLRFFLGISFLSAGWDKLTDPNYLNPAASNYIGHQIERMSTGSPIGGFLLNVAVPNAGFFGVLVMGGELLIGLAVLLGMFTRFSAIMGLLVNLTFFLSATWEIRPFYFGADLPYVAGWLTLALAGAGPYALDRVVNIWAEPKPVPPPAPVVPARGSGRGGGSNRPQPRPPVAPVAQPPATQPMTRRVFVGAGLAGLVGVALASSGFAWTLLHPQSDVAEEGAGNTTASPAQEPATATPSSAGGVPAVTQAPAEATAATAATATPAAAPPSGTLLAAAGTLQQGSMLEFQLPNGDPAVLAHNNSGYSAYVAVCTHQGCQVQPEGGGLLGCPCHGAEFDTSQNGGVVRGPARRPLSSVPVTVDAQGNVYLNPS